MRKIKLRLIVLRPFNHRVDDIRLPPPCHLFAHKLPHLRGLRLGRLPRHNGRTPRRQLINHRNVHIPINRQRERPRNRCRRHHQHIGVRDRPVRIWLLHQLKTLLNPKTMLLVHYYQPQIRKVDLLLNQRVRPNRKLRFPPQNPPTALPLRRLVQRPRQQSNPIRLARRRRNLLRQQLPRRQIMLRRQNLRRSHQRRLVAVLDRHQRRLHRHNRLAGAHIPLQQPPHRLRIPHVPHNLAQNPLLRWCRMKWQHLFQGLTNIRPRHKRRTRPLPHTVPL